MLNKSTRRGAALVLSKALNILIVLALLLTGTVLGTMAVPRTAKADTFEADTGGWTYEGDSYRYTDDTHGPGDRYSVEEWGEEYVVLTKPEANQAGVLWLNQDIGCSFTASFRYMAAGGTGGEGLVFMFLKDKFNGTPAGGGSLGFVPEPGFAPGYGIEFDNFHNSYDPSGAHVALIKDSTDYHMLEAAADGTATELNEWRWVEVDVQHDAVSGNSTVMVQLDHMIVLKWKGALDRSYSGIGFSAATGDGGTDWHIVDDVQVRIRDAFVDDTGLWSSWSTDGQSGRDTGALDVVLTEAQSDQAGILWLQQEITSPFGASFTYTAGKGTGAEGLVFMFYKDDAYIGNAEPGTGGNLAFNPQGGTAAGYGIEFDSLDSGWEPIGYLPGSHVALIQESTANHLASGNLTLPGPYVDSGDMDLALPSEDSGYYTVESDSYSQMAGEEFTVNITAYYGNNTVATEDSSGNITLTSNSPSMLFDADGDDVFGEPGDNTIIRPPAPTSNPFSIQAMDTAAGDGVVITVENNFQERGNSSYYSINADKSEDNQEHWVCVQVGWESVDVWVDGAHVIAWTGELDRTYGGIGFGAATGSAYQEQRIDSVTISVPDLVTRNLDDLVSFLNEDQDPVTHDPDGYLEVADSASSPGLDGVVEEGSLKCSMEWEDTFSKTFTNIVVPIPNPISSKKSGDTTVIADLNVTIPRVKLSFSPTLNFGVEIGESINAKLGLGGTVGLDCDVQATATGFVKYQTTHDLWSYKKVLVQWADFVPIEEEVTLTLYIGLKAQLDGAVTVESGVKGSAGIYAEAGYWDGKPFYEVKPTLDFSAKPVTYNADVTATLRVFAGVELEVLLYSAVGGTFKVQPYAELTGTFGVSDTGDPTVPVPRWSWGLGAGVDLIVAMKVRGVPASKLPKYTYTPVSTQIAGDQQLYNPTGLEFEPKSPGDYPAKLEGSGTSYTGHWGREYTFRVKATDGDGDNIQYEIDWGDGTKTVTPWSPSGDWVELTHSWLPLGTGPETYTVEVTRVEDSHGGKCELTPETAELDITIENRYAPNKPTNVSGQTEGVPANLSYPYTYKSTDLESDRVKLTFDWGDGTDTTTGLVGSGTLKTLYHKWAEQGNYTIYVKATDKWGKQSDWSAGLKVEVVANDPPPREQRPFSDPVSIPLLEAGTAVALDSDGDYYIGGIDRSQPQLDEYLDPGLAELRLYEQATDLLSMGPVDLERSPFYCASGDCGGVVTSLAVLEDDTVVAAGWDETYCHEDVTGDCPEDLGWDIFFSIVGSDGTVNHSEEYIYPDVALNSVRECRQAGDTECRIEGTWYDVDVLEIPWQNLKLLALSGGFRFVSSGYDAYWSMYQVWLLVGPDLTPYLIVDELSSFSFLGPMPFRSIELKYNDPFCTMDSCKVIVDLYLSGNCLGEGFVEKRHMTFKTVGLGWVFQDNVQDYMDDDELGPNVGSVNCLESLPDGRIVAAGETQPDEDNNTRWWLGWKDGSAPGNWASAEIGALGPYNAATALEVDPDGTVYVTGIVTMTDDGSSVPTNSIQAFSLPDLELLWATESEGGVDLALTDDDDILVYLTETENGTTGSCGQPVVNEFHDYWPEYFVTGWDGYSLAYLLTPVLSGPAEVPGPGVPAEYQAAVVSPGWVEENITGLDGNFTFDWGDGNVTTVPAAVGQAVSASHSWAAGGSYTVGVSLQVTDTDNGENYVSRPDPRSELVVTVNYAPDTPPAPEGETYVNLDDKYIYRVITSDPDGDYIDYQVDWGDEITVVNDDPRAPGTEFWAMHRWSDFGSGVYTVRVRAIDELGAWSGWSEPLEVTVNHPPEASFHYTTADETETPAPTVQNTSDWFVFTDTSFDTDGEIVACSWDFGDGNSTEGLVGDNVAHRYEHSGTYTVTLTVTDCGGSEDTCSQLVTVANTPPVAGFASRPVSETERNRIQFWGGEKLMADGNITRLSWDTDGGIVWWEWDFGDGYTSNEPNPVHEYEVPGTYVVTLTVTDNEGATDTTAKEPAEEAKTLLLAANAAEDDEFTLREELPRQVMVFPSLANFSAEPMESMETGQPQEIVFTDQSLNFCARYDIVSWTWDFGDGTAASWDTENRTADGVIRHSYRDSGTYTVTLTVVDEGGNTGTKTRNVTILNMPPEVDISSELDACMDHQLTTPGSFADCSPEDTWTATVDYGDGSGVQPLPLAGDKTFQLCCTYTVCGEYTITVAVSDDKGGTGTATSLVTVTPNQPPVADAGGPYAADEGSEITFDAGNSTDAEYEPLRYRWDFDDNGTWDTEWSLSATAVYTWYDDYEGTVAVEVSDGELTSTAAAMVSVLNVVPTVEAGPDQTAECTLETVSLAGSFSDPGFLDTHTIHWDFGDGAAGDGSLNASYVYTTCGTYTVTLTVTDDDGGIGRDEVVVTVVDTTAPLVTVTNPPGGAALQDGIHFEGSASDAGSGVATVRVSVREDDGATGIPVGYEGLPATYDPGTGSWVFFFDTLQLPDGYYLVIVQATDNQGNTGSITVPYSIRNWAVLELLPATEENNPGRTMPVKFSLRVAAAVDPDQPYVYNENLTIRILGGGDVLQTSVFGTASTDYRIDVTGEKYITNFKTLKQPMEYTVEIWRTGKNFLVGSLAFETVR